MGVRFSFVARFFGSARVLVRVLVRRNTTYYTIEGVTKDTNRRVMGSVAALLASSAILARPVL